MVFNNSLLKNESYMKKILIFCFVFMFFSANAFAQPAISASKWIDVKGREFLSIFAEEDLDQRASRIEKMFYDVIDVNYIAKFVIGRFWREMSEQEKEYYLEVFPNYAVNSYKNIPIVFNASFKVLKEKKVKEHIYEVTVKINIEDLEELAENEDFSTLYFKVKAYADDYRILDVKTEAGSLLLVYRTQFAEMLKERGYDYIWFIDDLQ